MNEVNRLTECETAEKETESLLHCIDTSKTVGPDGVGRILKECKA